MNKVLTIFVAYIFCIVMMSPVNTFAAEIQSNERTGVLTQGIETDTPVDDPDVPEINETVMVSLNTTTWSNVVTYTNIITDYPTVTNHADNPAMIEVRIINTNTGLIISGPQDVYKGGSVTLGPIPALTKCTLQARAIFSDGSYSISID